MANAHNIHEAYRQGDLEALKAALNYPPNFPNQLGQQGLDENCLEYAIYHSPISFVRTLLEIGADPNCDDRSFPSLIAALSTSRPDKYDVVLLLHAYGADLPAAATDGSGVSGKASIQVISPEGTTVPVSAITVTSADNSTTVLVGDTLQMMAAVVPSTATDKSVSWSVVPGTGLADISATGLLTGISAGTITVVATANDGSGVQGFLDINVSESSGVLVSTITVYGEGGANFVSVQGSLKMIADIDPDDAANKNVTWSVKNGPGKATINSNGNLTGIKTGNVTVIATANDGSGVKGTEIINVIK